LRLANRLWRFFFLGIFIVAWGMVGSAQVSSYSSLSDKNASLQDELLTKVILRLSGKVVAVPATKTAQGIVGLWHPKSRTIYIFMNENLAYEDYKEILRHEAVHMAQYCNGLNQASAAPIPIGAIVGDSAQASYSLGRQKGLYGDAQSVLEAEAYTLESGSDQDVISLLELLCINLKK
jgi:hypothetical protein